MKDKTILITGASSGIGQACAELFAQQGARLIICARRKQKLDKLAEQLKSKFDTDCLSLELDVQDKAQVQSVLANLDNIDVLINNAGLALGSDPIQTGSLDNWETMIDTNLKGLLYVTRQILPGMIKRDVGHIINLGSIAGHECYPNGNVYCATKYAVRALSKSMRLDLLGTSIRVSEISPGAVETEFSEVRWNDKDRAKAFYQDFDPLMASDIADAALYCASRPAHVNVAEMIILPSAQAAASCVYRGGKRRKG